MKPTKKRDLKKKVLYGMTPEQYNEGNEIHFKCFEPVERMTLQLITEQSSM